MERSHSSTLSVARASHDQETWSTTRGSLKEITIEVRQMWQELFHIRWRFKKGITLERNHSIAQSVARDFSRSRDLKYHQRILEENNHWSATNVTVAFPRQVKIHEGNYIGEKPFNCTKCGKSFSRSKYLKVPSEDPWRKKHWSFRSFSTSRFKKGMTLERSNSSACSVARASHDQET